MPLEPKLKHEAAQLHVLSIENVTSACKLRNADIPLLPMQYQQAVHAVQPAGCLKLYLRVTRCTLDAGLHVSMGVWQNFINALGVGSKKVGVIEVIACPGSPDKTHVPYACRYVF